jgi:hypothetical protein
MNTHRESGFHSHWMQNLPLDRNRLYQMKPAYSIEEVFAEDSLFEADQVFTYESIRGPALQGHSLAACGAQLGYKQISTSIEGDDEEPTVQAICVFYRLP